MPMERLVCAYGRLKGGRDAEPRDCGGTSGRRIDPGPDYQGAWPVYRQRLDAQASRNL